MAKIDRFNEFDKMKKDKLKEEIKSLLERQMKIDEKSYTGHIKTKYNSGSPWSSSSWLIDEILQFLSSNYSSSYILREFGKFGKEGGFNFIYLSDILEDLYPTEFEKASKIWYDRNE